MESSRRRNDLYRRIVHRPHRFPRWRNSRVLPSWQLSLRQLYLTLFLTGSIYKVESEDIGRILWTAGKPISKRCWSILRYKIRCWPILKDDNMAISNQKERLLSAVEVKEKADAFSYPDKSGLHTISLVIRVKDENRPVIKMVLYKSTMLIKLEPNRMDYNIHVPASKCFEKASHAMLNSK